MKKEGVIVSLIVILVCFVSLVSANSINFTLGNYSLSKDTYGYGETLSGQLELSLNQVPADVELVSDFGETSLRDLLKASGTALPCESFSCSPIYSPTGTGATTLQLVAVPATKVLGLYFSGAPISVNSFSMDLYSTFGEQKVVPFNLSIGNSFSWQFNIPSENMSNTRASSTGCFDSSAPLSYPLVGETAYCENVSVLESGAYFLGANLSGYEDIRDFTFSLKDHGVSVASPCVWSRDGTVLGTSNYTDSNNGCFVYLASPLKAGYYDACISSNGDISNYTLLSESSGTNCGSYGNVINRTEDYSIYAITPSYASNTGAVDLGADFPSSAIGAINAYLQQVYGRDCTNGCIVPIAFSGSGVNLNLSNLLIRYSSSGGITQSSKFYSVSNVLPQINLPLQQLSLDNLNWKLNTTGNENFTLSLFSPSLNEKDTLFSLPITLVPSPVIKDLYPKNIPAGINFLLYADVTQAGSSPSYTWSFGDGGPTVTTSTNTVSHIFQNLSDYNVTLSVTGNNYTATKTFIITTISPQDYLNLTFEDKQNKLDSIASQIAGLNPLIKDFVTSQLNISSLQESLNNLKLDMGVAISSEDYVAIAQSLDSLVMPELISHNELTGSYFPGDSSPDPSVLLPVSAINSSELSKYPSAILNWQSKEMQIQFYSDNVHVTNEDGTTQDLLTLYTIGMNSQFANESYFVVSAKKSSLNIASTDLQISDLDSATAFILPPNSASQISFFVASPSNLSFFISPRLELVPIDVVVSPCNFNGICESGENYSNCRSDCKPVLPTIFLSIILVVFLLILYTLIQLWYKLKYENYLFKDRRELFNLVIFLNTAQKENIPEDKIRTDLYAQSWTPEQVSYAIRKSQGKNVGMPEIIPIDKLIMHFERRKAISNPQTQAPANPFPRVQLRSIQRPPFGR